MKYLEKIKIWRFHVRCMNCRNVIVFRTDPENQDYDIVSGGIRSQRSAYVRAREDMEQAKIEKELEERDPMKVLEERTLSMKNELLDEEIIEDLMDARARPKLTDPGDIKDERENTEVEKAKKMILSQRLEDEEEVREMLRSQNVVILNDEDEDNDVMKPKTKVHIKLNEKPKADKNIFKRPSGLVIKPKAKKPALVADYSSSSDSE